MKFTSVTTVSRTFTIGIFLLGCLALLGVWNVYSLVKSVTGLVSTGEASSSRNAEASNRRSPVDPEPRPEVIQALRRQMWWVVGVLLMGAPVIVGLLVAAKWMLHREFALRQITDQRLRERESRLQAILDSEPECVKLVAEDGTLLEMNAAGLQMIEARESQVIGHQVESLLAPEYRRAFQLLNEKVFRGESATLEYEIIGLKGGQRWLETHAAPLRDEQGRVVAQLGITKDITERKQAEAALRESEAHYRLLADNADDFVSLSDTLGNRLYVSPSYFRVTGWTLEELQQFDWRTRLHPDDLPMIERAREANLAGDTTLIEHRIHCKYGSWIWVELRCKPLLGPEGEVLQLLQWSRDITERKRIEQELRAIQASLEMAQAITRIGSWEFDPFRCAGRWSKEMYRLFDRDPKLGAPTFEEFLEFVHPDDRHILLDANSQVAQLERTVEVSYRVAPAFGGMRYFSGKVHATRDALGRVIQLAGTLWDVTELKLAEEALRASESQYRLLADNTDDFVQLIDRQGTLPYLSPSFFRATGWSLEEIRNVDWRSRLHPEDLPMVERARSAAFAGETTLTEHRIRCKAGGWIWVEMRRKPIFDDQGEVHQVLLVSRDITARKKVQTALQESRLMLERAQSFGHIGTWFADPAPDGEIQWSAETCRIFGLTPERFDGQSETFFELIHPDDRERVRSTAREALESDRPYQMEYRIQRSDGLTRWIHQQAGIDCDESGWPLRIVGVVQDVTQRKLAEEALRQSQEHLTEIIHSMDGIVWELDIATFRFTFVSQRAEELLGYPVAQWTASSSFWTDHIHPDDREWAVRFCTERTEQGLDHEFEYRMQSADGRIVWLRDLVTVVLKNGQPVKLRGIMVDITERKQIEFALQKSETMLELVLDSIPQGVFWKDRQSLYLGANRVARQAMGFDGAGSVVGRSDFEVPNFSPEQVELFVGKDREVMATDQPQFGIIETLSLPDGTVISLETNKMPMHDVAGNVCGVLGTWQDITARKLAEEAVRRSERQFRNLLEKLPAGAYTCDANGLITYFNEQAVALWGQAPKLNDPEDRFCGSFKLYSADGELLPRSECWMALALRNHHEYLGRMAIIERLDGTRRTVLAHVTPLHDEFGQLLGAVNMLVDITERQLVEDALRESQQRLAKLTRQLITAQENERRHVAHELHDEIGQVLTAVRLNLYDLKFVCDSAAATKLDAGLTLVAHAMQQVRELSLNLRPPMLDVLGLDAALRECVEQHRKQTGNAVQLEVHLESRLTPELEITCYRVIQSSLTNICRHAQASQVSIEIRQSDLGLELTVRDNGIGLEVDGVRQRSQQGESFGILAMEERVQLVGGTFRIDSAAAPGFGTSIYAHLPLVKLAASEG